MENSIEHTNQENFLLRSAMSDCYDEIYAMEQEVIHHADHLRALERKMIKARCALKRAMEGVS